MPDDIASTSRMLHNRRAVLKGAAFASAAGVLTMANLSSTAAAEQKTLSSAPTESKFWLTNVTLEDGFERNSNNLVIATKTRMAHLRIEDGHITQITSQLPSEKDSAYDMKGLLALPAFADMHVHLDKGHYGGPWKAATPFVSVQDRIREEEGFLKDFLPDTARRAKALLDLITSYGTTFVRVQCNVDPVIGLQNGEKVLEALHAFSDKVDYDLVAFPQHGLLRDGMPALMDQALKSGFTVVGGVDPATIDTDIERSLNIMMELAVKHNAPIDIHLHNGTQLGTFTIQRLAALTEEAKWHNRVSVSHAYCLGAVPDWHLDSVLDQIASAGISINSTAPIDTTMPPAAKLTARGIPLHMSTDCINDHWSSYGSGSIIERASRLGEINDWNDEYSLNRTLRHITKGRTPLDDKGTPVWPRAGDKAEITFVDASCSAELIARRNPVHAVLHKGKPSIWKI